MPDLNFAIIALEVVAIATVLVLYIIEYRRDRRLHEQSQRPLLEKLQAENAQVLHEAMKKSQEIVSSAQAEGLKIISDAQTTSKKAQEDFEAAFMQLRENMQQSLSGEMQKGLEEFSTYLKDLQTKSSASQTQVEAITKQKVNEFIERFEQNLSDFLIQTQQKSLAAVDLELTSARSLIENYKEQQIKIINENVLAMLERTLALVLSKKLSIKEHMDLIYESLEKAKTEKFIV